MSLIIWSGSEPSMTTVFQMTLVQVIAREHRRVRLAEPLGNVGLAFEADAEWALSKSR